LVVGLSVLAAVLYLVSQKPTQSTAEQEANYSGQVSVLQDTYKDILHERGVLARYGTLDIPADPIPARAAAGDRSAMDMMANWVSDTATYNAVEADCTDLVSLYNHHLHLGIPTQILLNADVPTSRLSEEFCILGLPGDPYVPGSAQEYGGSN